jgi:hypothetical protein
MLAVMLLRRGLNLAKESYIEECSDAIIFFLEAISEMVPMQKET